MSGPFDNQSLQDFAGLFSDFLRPKMTDFAAAKFAVIFAGILIVLQ